MLNYTFMQYAFIMGIMLAIIIPIIGKTCVLKRISMSGDALSHTALLGVAIGLIAGSEPLFVAIIVCVVASLIIEVIRKKFNKYAEISIVVVMSGSMALAVILSKFTSNASFSSYLFGSILLVRKSELIITAIILVITLLFYIGFHHQIMYSAYNETQAKLDGVHVDIINLFQTIITACVIAISSKIIGALMVSALMVIPYASSLQLTKRYKYTTIFSIIFSVISIVVGLLLSFYLDLQPGGTIVLCSIVILIITMIINHIFKLTK